MTDEERHAQEKRYAKWLAKHKARRRAVLEAFETAGKPRYPKLAQQFKLSERRLQEIVRQARKERRYEQVNKVTTPAN